MKPIMNNNFEQAGVQTPTSAVNVTLPAFVADCCAEGIVPGMAGAVAAECWWLLSIDISCP